MLDVDTCGTGVARDRLISIGPVALHANRRVGPAGSFEVVCRQAAASAHDNILIHGIGIEAQLRGIEPEQATARFIDYAGVSPRCATRAVRLGEHFLVAFDVDAQVMRLARLLDHVGPLATVTVLPLVRLLPPPAVTLAL